MSSDRWRERGAEDITLRAFREAKRLGHSWCGVEHVLLALLDPPTPTDAADLLVHLGLTRSEAEGRLAGRWKGAAASTNGGVISSTPALSSLLGMAQGLAVAWGADHVTDEHVLLALSYGAHGSVPPVLVSLGVDPDAVVRGLSEQGQHVPPRLPPEPPPTPGPMGPLVYYPAGEQGAVVRAMIERFPPGTALWGFNMSRWKPGYHWVSAEASCNALEVISGAVSDPSLIEVVAQEEGARQEEAAEADQ